MSRRTKLIIAALFLVLLAIPLGYLVISWSPANPLEFRLVKQPVPYDPFNPTSGILVIEMKNTSSVPIYVAEVKMRLPGTPGSDPFSIDRSSPVDSARTWQDSPVLQPGEVWSCSDRVSFDVSSGGGLDGASIEYTWFSANKLRAQSIAYWLYIHLPRPINNWSTPFQYEVTTSPLRGI